MTQITDQIKELAEFISTQTAEEFSPTALAQSLLDAGWVKTSSDPAAFMADSYTQQSGDNLQALVNHVVEASNVKVPPFKQDDYVQVLKDGVWLNGVVSSMAWGQIEVDTARGPVTALSTGNRIRHQS